MCICPVCNEQYDDIFKHWYEHSDIKNEQIEDEHILFFIELLNFIDDNLAHSYSCKVAEDLIEAYDFDEDIVDDLTTLVSRHIDVLGYSIRKRADKLRTRIPESFPTSKSHYFSTVLKKIVFPNYPDFDDKCIYCGEQIGLPLKLTLDDKRYYTDATLVQLSYNQFDTPVLSDVAQLCLDCQKDYMQSPFVSVTRIFTFAAAHHLPYHKGLCQFTHGHEWKLEVAVKRRQVKKTGMVIDFSDLKKFVNENIVDILDHNYVNDFIYNPTAENICYWVWNVLSLAGLKGIDRIRVWEAPNSIAEITLRDMVEKVNAEREHNGDM